MYINQTEFKRYSDRYYAKDFSDEVFEYFSKIALSDTPCLERIKSMHRCGYMLEKYERYEDAAGCYSWVIGHYQEDDKKDVIGSSLFNLGLMYKLGKGVEQDLDKAIELFKTAAGYANNEGAKKQLDKMGVKW